MDQHPLEEQAPWVSCFLTDILITYLEETRGGETGIDYARLFQGVEGVETPADPERFLRDLNNWVPLGILRDLASQCERLSGRYDVAYHAARAYFDPVKKDWLSPFTIIFQVLNDFRSVFLSAHLWASVQTNYLTLQCFESQGPPPVIHMLARFAENARPRPAGMHFLRGFSEGFPRLYPFIEDVRCVQEYSQVRIEDLVEDFPDFSLTSGSNGLSIRHRGSQRIAVEAERIPLRTEVIPISPELWPELPEAVVVPPEAGRLTVLTCDGDPEPRERSQAPWAYRITRPGTLSSGDLSCRFEVGAIFNAPYSRFRIRWRESPPPQTEISADELRREVSHLLYQHLKQIKQTQFRMVQHNIEKRTLALENIRLKEQIEREHSFAGLIGQSKAMQELFGVVRSIADTDVTVLIQGETGTGKELIARAIHDHSPRRAKRFVAVNCGALAETLLESELFGHEKGAFTGATTRRSGVFEVADGGTLFLDEIGEIAPSTQIRLLRVLQEGEFQRLGGSNPIRVDVRIVSATDQNLEELVRTGRFRQDLYYRLKVFPIRVPPLRERKDDIPLLVSHFVRACNRKMRKSVSGVSPEAMTVLMSQSWPGNVRELENVIQRMVVVAKDDSLEMQDLPGEMRASETLLREKAKDLKEIARGSTEIVEREAILATLAKTGGNVSRAAKALGVSRATLQNKMKLYGLRGPRG